MKGLRFDPAGVWLTVGYDLMRSVLLVVSSLCMESTPPPPPHVGKGTIQMSEERYYYALRFWKTHAYCSTIWQSCSSSVLLKQSCMLLMWHTATFWVCELVEGQTFGRFVFVRIFGTSVNCLTEEALLAIT